MKYVGPKITIPASIAGGASFNITPGAAPTTPVDGDVWTTSAGLYVQINGATVGPLGTGGGGGGSLTDGDYGDIVVSGGSTVFTVDTGAISYGKLQVDTGFGFIGRNAPSSGALSFLNDGAAAFVTGSFRGVYSLGGSGTLTAANTISGKLLTTTNGSAMTLPASGSMNSALGGTEVVNVYFALNGNTGSFSILANGSETINLGPGGTNTTTSILVGFGEVAVLQYDVSAGKWTYLGKIGGVSALDKGDITVTNYGLTWTVDAASITYSKMQNESGFGFIGRANSASGSQSFLTEGSAAFVAGIFRNIYVLPVTATITSTNMFSGKLLTAPNGVTMTLPTTSIMNANLTGVFNFYFSLSGDSGTMTVAANGTDTFRIGAGATATLTSFTVGLNEIAVVQYDAGLSRWTYLGKIAAPAAAGPAEVLPIATETSTDAPTAGTPSTGISFFAATRANRRQPAYIAPTGRTERLQTFLGANDLKFVDTTGAGPTASATVGYTTTGANMAADVAGTFGLPALAITNFLTMQNRKTLAVAATVNLIMESKATNIWCSRRSVGGGFHFSIRFGLETALPATGRLFAGLTSSTGAIASGDLLGVLANSVGLFKNSADSTLRLMLSAAAGTNQAITLTNTGAAGWNVAGMMFQVELFCAKGDAGFGYRVTRWDATTGATIYDEGYVSSGNMPAIDTLFVPHLWAQNVAATATTIAFVQMYCETD